MTYRTTLQPLTFWKRVVSRLDTDFHQKQKDLTTLLLPGRTTIEGVTAAQARADVDRAAVTRVLGALEVNRMVKATITQALYDAEIKAGIEKKTCKIKSIADIISVYEQVSRQDKSRLRAAEDILETQSRYTALLNAGNSEYANAERQRLRSVELPVLAVGREDVGDVRETLQFFTSLRDEWQSEVEALLHATRIYVDIEDDFFPVIKELGVSYNMLESQGDGVKPQEPSAASEPEPIVEPSDVATTGAAVAAVALTESAATDVREAAPAQMLEQTKVPAAEGALAAHEPVRDEYAPAIRTKQNTEEPVAEAAMAYEAPLASGQGAVKAEAQGPEAQSKQPNESEAVPEPALASYEGTAQPAPPSYVPSNPVPLELELLPLPDEFELMSTPVERPASAGQSWLQ